MKLRSILCGIGILILPFSQAQCQIGGSGLKSSTKIEPLKPLDKPVTANRPQTPPATTPVSTTKPSFDTKEAVYFYPGILVSRGNKWVGGDQLLNLSQSIGVYLNLIQSESDPLVINEAGLLEVAKKIFEQAGISPFIEGKNGEAPLPFFQIQLLLYPVGSGYAAACEARLFESVVLRRFVLEPSGMAFQAITWQKTSLVVSSTASLEQKLKQEIEVLVRTFVDRVKEFEKIKK